MGSEMLENPDEAFIAIVPIFFALASGEVLQYRRELDEEEWTELLSSEGLTAEEYLKYEDWWFSSSGKKILEQIATQFYASILSSISSNVRTTIGEFLEHANWKDFIRELSDCSEGDSYYFIEYAVDQGLCWQADFTQLENSNIDREIFNSIMEKWFKDSQKFIRSTYLDVYFELAKLKSKS